MENSFFEILIYFIIYSFLGWVLESIVRTICERKPINTGFLKGPFCPIYGCGAIIMIVFLSKFSYSWILLFIMSIIFLSLWEYIVGVFLEKVFKTKYWDYSNHKFNYKGRLCLTNSIAWGFLGVLFIKYIHPFIIQVLDKVDIIYLEIIVPILLIILIIDAIISIVKIKKINVTLQKIETLNQQIKEKLKEITEQEKFVTSENIQMVVDQMKLKRDKIVKRLYKRVYRLKKAFPAINTKEFTEILNQKIEIHKIKNSIKGKKEKK